MKEIADFNTRYMNFCQSERNSKNVMDIPRLKYVVLSAGCGKLHKDTNKIEYIVDEIANIAGQRAVKSKIKQSISNFGVREGAVVGVYTTLRGRTMRDFIDRFILINLPRMQELMGLSSKAFDSSNNYNIGIKRQDIFVESKGLDLFGLNVCIGIHAKSKSDAASLLKAMGFPLYGMGGHDAN